MSFCTGSALRFFQIAERLAVTTTEGKRTRPMQQERIAVIEAPPVMMTIGEAAALLHVQLSTLRRWEKSGWLHSTRVGPRGQSRYNRDFILGLAERGVGPGSRETEA